MCNKENSRLCRECGGKAPARKHFCEVCRERHSAAAIKRRNDALTSRRRIQRRENAVKSQACTSLDELMRELNALNSQRRAAGLDVLSYGKYVQLKSGT